MNIRANTARALYLQLRALGLEIRTDPGPERTAGHGIAVGGLRSLNPDHADRLMRLVQDNEAGLLEILQSERNRNLEAVRQEGSIL